MDTEIEILKIKSRADEILKERKNTFPVGIEEIVKSMGIGLYETNLNVAGLKKPRMEKVYGYLRKKMDGTYAINLDYKESPMMRRYIIAHELGKYVLGHEAIGYYSNIKFVKKWSGIECEAFAAFILFPPELVLKELREYNEHNKYQYPLERMEWIQHLQYEAQIPYHETLISCQYVKWYLCWLCNNDPENGLLKEYSELIRN